MPTWFSTDRVNVSMHQWCAHVVVNGSTGRANVISMDRANNSMGRANVSIGRANGQSQEGSLVSGQWYQTLEYHLP